MKIAEIQEMSVEELTKKLREQKEELFNLRFQHSIHQLDNPMIIVSTKKTIARILTVLRQKELKSTASGKEQ